MPTPQEIEAAAGIRPTDELDRRRIWAAAQALAGGAGPSVENLQTAQRVLLAVAGAAVDPIPEGAGRAIITLTDGDAPEEVDIAVEFQPELEEAGPEEVAGTPAQLLALEVLETAFGDAEPQ